ncbi:ABC transporter permease [Nitratireductor sp. GZWM139]|uniref:ABC transporter permease n=1 Tax=Nitratireductor sp. GZWM139 TaxID=2950541 RepID=UPI0024BE734A|nr:ABC transporter permease [Nitratireductor sp. GZWM139]MDJ1466143.1 ABC transporter permease [Nitratireductor sp. GZWM139]
MTYSHQTAGRRSLGTWLSRNAGNVLLELTAGTIMLFLVAPILVIVIVSFSSANYLSFPPSGFSLRWYVDYLNQPGWVDATILSVWTAACVTVIATILGTAASIGMVRGRFPGKRIINACILSPLIVPGIVVAIAVYFFYVRIGLIGSPLAIIAAHSALAAPFVVLNVTATLYGFNERLEHAAQNLGATRWQTFRYITLPIIRPGIVAGALLAFVTSFDELIVALFVSGTGAVTLPRKMWDSIRFGLEPTIASVSVLTIIVSVLAFLSAELLRRRTLRMMAKEG